LILEFQVAAHIAPMKKPRVIIQTVSSHRIYVEHNGERTHYAVTDKLGEAKNLVRKAKRVPNQIAGFGAFHVSRPAR
jgi:hypothetical protein